MFRPFSNKRLEVVIHENNPFASLELANAIRALVPENRSKRIVVICIGTDRSTGDSLGPLVGSFLQEKRLPTHYSVFGTLDEPVHAVNLVDRIKDIDDRYPHAFKLAVDACLGRSQHVGTIYCKDGPVKPGAGVNKTLPPVGDAHITGIVNVAGFMEYVVLQNTRLHLVMKLAKTIADGIYKASVLSEWERRNSVHFSKRDSSLQSGNLTLGNNA
ncbi:spore protease YyaC [Fervidibacillus albus]|uniref:Spore protease YyaC n=1 Tax=Fervidibacillus albus TaxID=2980026 RepID=A0A9E8RW17_9BACI|nr:spore protease YyaC [Fervidibacillus albus]WAA09543.1 spore protease YyaC [Fervidibacillus albus]